MQMAVLPSVAQQIAFCFCRDCVQLFDSGGGVRSEVEDHLGLLRASGDGMGHNHLHDQGLGLWHHHCRCESYPLSSCGSWAL